MGLFGLLMLHVVYFFLNDKNNRRCQNDGKDIYIIHNDGNIIISCKLHIYGHNSIEYKNRKYGF